MLMSAFHPLRTLAYGKLDAEKPYYMNSTS